jgi:hypothetical protein
MKNQFKIVPAIILFAMSIMFTSCASKQNVSGLKVSRTAITGTWIVNKVTLEGFPMNYKVTDAFEMAPYLDFMNSTWQLNGNYKGIITLSNGTSQEIYWSLFNERTPPIFQFKNIDDEKAKNVNEGFQLEIADANKERLILKSPIRLATGNTAYIVYTLGI